MYKHYRIILIGVLVFFVTLSCNALSNNQPAATLAPAPTPIEGWEKFEARGVELWLPESFEGGNLEKDLDTIAEKLISIDPGFQQLADTIKQNPDLFVIWAFDTVIGESGGLTSATITTEKVLSVVTLDTYMDAAIKQLPTQFEVVDRDIVSLDKYQAGRLLVDFTVPGALVKEAMFIIKDENVIWTITYGTAADEFEERLPIFERSANTFTIQD